MLKHINQTIVTLYLRVKTGHDFVKRHMTHHAIVIQVGCLLASIGHIEGELAAL